MSSLWTPGGEHRVPRPQDEASGGAGDDWRQRLAAGDLDLDDLTPDQRREVEEVVAEMAKAQAQLLATPIEHLVAQHVVGLRELAILHLQQPEPNLGAAKVAIDAVAAILEAVGARLGELEAPLRADLQQLQLAFVSASDRSSVDESASGNGEG